MDRYITITKHKSSLRASSTLELHLKQSKNSSDNVNHFAIFAEKEKEDNKPAKKEFRTPTTVPTRAYYQCISNQFDKACFQRQFILCFPTKR